MDYHHHEIQPTFCANNLYLKKTQCQYLYWLERLQNAQDDHKDDHRKHVCPPNTGFHPNKSFHLDHVHQMHPNKRLHLNHVVK